MSVTLSERDFASNYLALLSVSESQVLLEESFRKDLKDITTLGIKLPNLPIPKGRSKDSNSQDEVLLNVSFKSIKPPRFNISTTIPAGTTIFEVKTNLVKNDQLKGIGPSQVKLLVKGKVIQDSALLSSIATAESEDVTFTVMINKESTSTTSVLEPETPSRENVTPAVTTIPWDDIKLLLEQKGLNSTEIITRLQKGWELTK